MTLLFCPSFILCPLFQYNVDFFLSCDNAFYLIFFKQPPPISGLSNYCFPHRLYNFASIAMYLREDCGEYSTICSSECSFSQTISQVQRAVNLTIQPKSGGEQMYLSLYEFQLVEVYAVLFEHCSRITPHFHDNCYAKRAFFILLHARCKVFFLKFLEMILFLFSLNLSCIFLICKEDCIFAYHIH